MEVELARLTCSQCGVSYWITEKHESHLRRCHNSFWCPNGHSQYFPGETDAERKIAKIQSERDEISRSNSALRGVITRMRNKT